MKKEMLMNYTDIGFQYLNDIVTDNRILLGSYSCGNYFAGLLKYIDSNKIKLKDYDLVIPILAEHQLDVLESKSFQKLALSAKNVVVNDYGTLYFLRNRKLSIRLGRLLFRLYRDTRYDDVENKTIELKLLDYYDFLHNTGCRFDSVEIDLVSTNMRLEDDGIDIFVHYPYRLLSCTRICEFAAKNREGKVVFQAEAHCCQECFNVFAKFENTNCYKIGKCIYEKLDKTYSKYTIDNKCIITEMI